MHFFHTPERPFLSIVLIFAVTVTASASTSTKAPLGAAKSEVPPLLQQMAGNWNVEERMWPAADARAIDLPAAVAKRQLIGGVYLEETMQPASDAGQSAFTRTAYFNYNAVTHRYEYASMDTRAPQLMVEKGVASGSTADRVISLQGGNFLAPKWGAATDVTFRYRLTIGPVEHDRQTVRLYLTPLSGTAGKEFLAFEYVYTRQY